MPGAIVLVILGYILYGIYWVIVNFWPFVLAGAAAIWAVPKIARFVSKAWKNYQERLADHKRLESEQNDLFLRFSDKPVTMRSFHPVYLLFVMIGCFVAVHAVSEAHDFARHEGWIREIPRDYRDVQYVIWTALFFLVTISVFSIITKIISRLVLALNFHPSYGQLLKQAHKINSPREALEIAPSLRAASKCHVRSPYDLFVFGHALLSKSGSVAKFNLN